jgi:ribonucleoside-diphosphate reductase alpha chain
VAARFTFEDVQDHVELGLMRGGHHEIARAYVLYREKRAQERARKVTQEAPSRPLFCMLWTMASASFWI